MARLRLKVFRQYVRGASSPRTSYGWGLPEQGALQTTPHMRVVPFPSILEVQGLFRLPYRARVSSQEAEI